jgi:hypothetical protein
MDNHRNQVPTGDGPAETKLPWVSPAVLDMGSMRQMTLLQGPTIPVEF